MRAIVVTRLGGPEVLTPGEAPLVPFSQMAALPLQGLTAWGLVHLAACVAPFGTLIFLGEASGAPAPVVIDDLYPGSQRVGAFGLDLDAAPLRFAQARTALAAGLCDGSLSLAIGGVFPLEQAAEAHRALEGRATIGKLILDLAPPPPAMSPR